MDMLLINGCIYTLNDADDVYEAVAFDEGRVARLGSTAEILELRTEETEIIDLKVRTVIPGFNDSHLHLLSYGYSKQIVTLDGCASLDELRNRVQNFIKWESIGIGEWVEGRRWDQNNFVRKAIPTRFDLDEISADRPIVLGRTCGQMCICNIRALEMLNLLRPLPAMEHGSALVDENGTPNGIFTGEAINLIYGKLPKLGVDRIKTAILRACDEYLTAGITSVQTDDFELKRAGTPEDVLNAYFQLDQAKELPIRVNLMMYLPTAKDIEDIIQKGFTTGYGSDFFKIGPCKTDTDGSLGARTAALEDDYSDDPGNRGEIYFNSDELDKMVTLADRHNCQFVCDAIGDRAINLVLDAYEKTLKGRENKLRFGIDHCQITNPEIIRRFRKMNILAGLELGFVMSDIYIADDRLGSQRSKYSYNWKAFVESGVICAAGSDNPVVPFEPLHGIYAAVTRRNWDGEPSAGWFPNQKLSVMEAVRMFTRGSAYATFEEQQKGTLEDGKFADAVILSNDIFNGDPEILLNTKIDKTIVNGKVQYSRH